MASIIANSHRAKDSESISPFDFIGGFEEDEADVAYRATRATLKNWVRVHLCSAIDKSADEVREMVHNMIARMKDQIEDPAELIREVFPAMEF